MAFARALALVASLLAGGGASAQTISPVDYLPLGEGAEWQLDRVAGSGESKLVTPGEGVHAQVLAHNRWNPTTMLIGLNADNPALHDVYRLDLASGDFTKIETNPGYAGWLIDPDLTRHSFRSTLIITTHHDDTDTKRSKCSNRISG